MIVETGHFCLVLALALAIVNAIVPLVGHYTRDGRLIGVAPTVAVAGFVFTALSFAAPDLRARRLPTSASSTWSRTRPPPSR